MDTGPSDVRPIFSKNSLRKIHISIQIFHNKIPLLTFCKKIAIKLLKILDFSEGLSINEKIGNFLCKISIKACVCLNKFLQNIVRTSIHVNLRNLKKNDNFGLKTKGIFKKVDNFGLKSTKGNFLTN